MIITILLASSGLSTGQPAVAAERVATYDTFDIDEPVITLTFDVTFDRGGGTQVLDTLASYGVSATFAITGVWAQQNPDLIQRMVDEGHHLMNHTWDHPSFTGEYTGSLNWAPTDPLSPAEVIDQLRRTEDLIRQQVGVELQPYVRPPYGDYDNDALTAMADAGYTYNIMWTVDTLGWHELPVDEVQQRALDAAQPGANILLHIGHGSTDEAALPGIIEGFQELGYGFATVEEFVEGNLAVQQPRYFPETGYGISGDFLRYWEEFGGLQSFGHPISAEVDESGVTAQYFERGRFEYAEDVGAQQFNTRATHSDAPITRERVRDVPYRSVRGASPDYCGHAPPSQHSVCGGFQETQTSQDGVTISMIPISPEFREREPDTGQVFIAQFIEHRQHPRRRMIRTSSWNRFCRIP